MSQLTELGRKPANVTEDSHFAGWFTALASRLMNDCDFVVAGARYRFAELEMYYSGDAHSDLFAHRDPLQREYARWYFHRTRGEYRGGSFKGLDLTFGDGSAYFGILIRTIVGSNGTFFDGPCVMVDHLLESTKTASVAALDGVINGRTIWDTTAPLHLAAAEPLRTANVYACSRVGLSLKKAKGKPDAPKFVGRAYRYLTEPQTISKGRPHLILSLYRTGHTASAIHEITKVAPNTIARYIADFDLGTQSPNFDSFIGNDLSTPDLCKLLGTWKHHFANKE
jgi:hypothetical protein